MPRLILKSGDGRVESFELRPGPNRLGRGRSNDIPIEHLTVSAAHCEIFCQEDGIRVRDCGSTNGTFIDGQPVKESSLTQGETLQVGDVKLVLEMAPVTVAIPQVEFGEPLPPPTLADGSQPCLNHPDVPARRICIQCHKCFCEPCVHTLRRVGGKVLKLCPRCSGRCEIIPGRDEGKRKKKSLLASLWSFKKTLRIPRKNQ